MNKSFENILERLEEKLKKSEERYHRYLDDSNLSCMFDRSDIEEKRVDTIKEMIEIVQEVAEEYKGGWIACSDRLPDKAWYEVIATLENGYGQRRVTIIFTGYGDSQWHCNHKEFDLDVWKVIAWQPLPEQFKERD